MEKVPILIVGVTHYIVAVPYNTWVIFVLNRISISVNYMKKKISINSQSTCNTSYLSPVCHKSRQRSHSSTSPLLDLKALFLLLVGADVWSLSHRSKHLFLFKHANKFTLRKACVEDDRKWWESCLHHTASEQKRALWVTPFSLLHLFPSLFATFSHLLVSLVLLVDKRAQICLFNQWGPISEHLLQRSRKWKRINCELDDLNSCHNISRHDSFKCFLFYGCQPLLSDGSQLKDLSQLLSLDLWDEPLQLVCFELWNHTLK